MIRLASGTASRSGDYLSSRHFDLFLFVIPAQAGIQALPLDSRFHGNDKHAVAGYEEYH